MRRKIHIMVWTSVIILSLLFNGCSLIQVKEYNSQTSSGPPLSQGKIHKIEPGVTTKEWILDAFGLPTKERDFGDGNEVLEYERSYRSEKIVKLFIIVDVNKVKKSKETLIIDLKDGIVQKYWVK